MNRSLITGLAAILLISAVASAQVTWVVRAHPVPTGQAVKMTFTNSSKSTITLWSAAPWAIYTAGTNGTLVYGPLSISIPTYLGTGKSITYTWNQRLANNALIKPGAYEAYIYYDDGGTTRKIARAPLTVTPDKMLISGSATPGNIVKFSLSSTNAPKLPYQVACSFSRTPVLPIGGLRELELAPDTLFFLSLTTGAPLFQQFSGVLDAGGAGVAGMQLPNIAALKGVTYYAAYVTLSSAAPSGIFSYCASRAIAIK